MQLRFLKLGTVLTYAFKIERFPPDFLSAGFLRESQEHPEDPQQGACPPGGGPAPARDTQRSRDHQGCQGAEARHQLSPTPPSPSLPNNSK